MLLRMDMCCIVKFHIIIENHWNKVLHRITTIFKFECMYWEFSSVRVVQFKTMPSLKTGKVVWSGKYAEHILWRKINKNHIAVIFICHLDFCFFFYYSIFSRLNVCFPLSSWSLHSAIVKLKSRFNAFSTCLLLEIGWSEVAQIKLTKFSFPYSNLKHSSAQSCGDFKEFSVRISYTIDDVCCPHRRTLKNEKLYSIFELWVARRQRKRQKKCSVHLHSQDWQNVILKQLKKTLCGMIRLRMSHDSSTLFAIFS